MKNKYPTRIKKIVRALKQYDPERVILFGSAARGDADAHSDIDLVVIKDTPERFLDRIGQVYDAVKPDYALDALVYTPEEFNAMHARHNPFIEEIIRDGIVIYDRTKGLAHEPPTPYSPSDGMRGMEAEYEARRWLEQAHADLAAAKWNEEGDFHSVACFLAQQTAERALKAFLYFRGQRRIIGHSVLEFADRCSRLDSDFKSLMDTAGTLDRYYIPTRYPNGLPGGVPAKVFGANEAKQALQIAETIVTLVASKIPPEHQEQ